MRLNKISPFLHWWLTPKLPEAQIRKILLYNPPDLSGRIRNILRTWLIHPLKRRIARYYLILLKKFFGTEVIAITGSAGKTTTKEMLRSILAQNGETVASFANIDPVYNIPTTILSARPTTRYLILEMGVEYPGEMDFYLWLAKPDIGIITNISTTHTEFFGSEEGVANEKLKLAYGLPGNAWLVLNGQDASSRAASPNIKANPAWFGKGSEITSESSRTTQDLNTKCVLKIGQSKIAVQLPVFGTQFVENALAAAASGRILGASLGQIKQGLEKFKPQEHRMAAFRLKNGALLIDDTYNNNPEAARRALAEFAKISRGKKRIIVFGDMLELGSLSAGAHQEIGRLIGLMHPNLLITVGQHSLRTAETASRFMPPRNIVSVAKAEEVIAKLPKLTRGWVVFLKGSRSIGLETVVSRLSRRRG